MNIEIEVGLNIVDAFPDCDVSRSLARYADQVADAARERYPDAEVTYRIDTRCGFGLRIDGLGEDETAWLRERADVVWEDTDRWMIDPRAEALTAHTGHEATYTRSHEYTSGRQTWLVVTESELVQLDGGFFAYRVG